MMKRGFTLVELLVVISIIVMLLALLVPALDRAIYQAELAVCAAQLHSIATGAVVYASGSKRYYPHREGVRDDIVWPTAQIYNGSPIVQGVYNGLWASEGATNFAVYDDRKVLRQFISLKALSDPLTGKVDFEDVDADATAYSTVNLWFGYGFQGHRKMKKLGDRFGWSEVVDGELRNWRFTVLASDRDTITTNGANVQSTHPDFEARTANAVFQNGNFGFGAKWVISLWRSNVGRAPVDLNFASDDGSVRRHANVAWNAARTGEMAGVPELQLGPPNDYRATMPPEK